MVVFYILCFRPPQEKNDIGTLTLLEDVRDVNERELTVTSLVYMSLSWLEPRLAIPSNKTFIMSHEATDPRNVDLLWTPDLYVYDLIRFDGKTAIEQRSVQCLVVGHKVYLT